MKREVTRQDCINCQEFDAYEGPNREPNNCGKWLCNQNQCRVEKEILQDMKPRTVTVTPFYTLNGQPHPVSLKIMLGQPADDDFENFDLSYDEAKIILEEAKQMVEKLTAALIPAPEPKASLLGFHYPDPSEPSDYR